MSSKSAEMENNTDTNSEELETKIELQLGDVIQISNPLNENINSNIFFIDYIDKFKMYLIDTDTLERIKLKISEDGTLGDGNIDRIAILSRSDTPSYARQNGLLTGKWINIYFGGEFPVIITGEITNLEQDMIEIKTLDDDIIYVNFDYKGIPEDLPIQNIEIREKPQEPVKSDHLEGEEEREENEENEEIIEDIQPLEPSRDYKMIDTEKIVPRTNVKDQLREFILKADQIKFGDEDLGTVVQYIDVSTKSQRYSLEEQLSDLQDELLSTIPNSQRTSKVLNNIHITIDRFKQLREKFSFFDKYGNIEGPIFKDANYKPLIEYFNSFKQNLYWILPVVKNIKKVYNTQDLDEKNTDIQNLLLEEDLYSIVSLINSYKSNTLPVEQNKYLTLYSELNSYFTPFELVNDENNDILIEKYIDDDINVIIDNLEDMYSSIFSNNLIKNRRFVIQKYNLGLTKLDTIDTTNSRIITTRIKMTNSDTMSIKSFVTLPESTIRFSKINLPGTSLLDKANLNLLFLNYWQFLNKKTNVNNIIIDNLDNEIVLNENNFVNNIKNYISNLSEENTQNFTKEQIYNKFINAIVPKTKILFNLMKKYIIGKLSIVDVVSYLEPFLIYSDDLTYQQYVEITKFINDKISENNKNYIDRSRLFGQLIRVKSAPLVNTRAYSIFTIIENTYKEDVFEGYDINIDSKLTNSEILRRIIIKDYGKLYTTTLSLQSIPLMFPNDISSIFENEKLENINKLKTEEKNNTCKTMTIAKYYKSLEDLQSDNDRIIYFDKKYDTTNYGLLDTNYAKELIKMSPDELKQYIINDLIIKRYNEEDADYLANTLLDGYKKIIDGQYALLYKGYKENSNEQVDYYVRRENKWVLDNDMANIINTDEANILCNLQKDCVSVPDKIDDKCESIEMNKITIETNLLKNVINEFDTRYKISRREFEREMKTNFDYYLYIINILTNIETYNMLKYNKQKYILGVSIEDGQHFKSVSPYAKLLDLIFGQRDFIKKQYDIVRFVNTFTRPSIESSNEDTHWLYCLKTDVPLLPIFKFDLASAYITNPDSYMDFLDILKSKIGKLSDDGDLWCDKHSGLPICPSDFDVEEGYEQGFKISTRAVLEDDAGNKIISASVEKITIYDSHEAKVINNIVNVLSIAMGINIENQKPLIINSVLSSIRDTLETENDYKEKIKEMANKGKKIMSYKDFYNSALLYYTLGMFLIATQTAIPSIKTRKTHPNCVRSFSGYPFEGSGDYSSLNYLVCVVNDIRGSSEPWNVLKGKKIELIIEKIKNSIDGILLLLPDVKRKMEEKTDYLLTSPANEIPKEHDISKWVNFLPPLTNFKIKHLNNISEAFQRELLRDLKSGSPNQKEKILVIHSKIIQFSLAIQEKIQDIVKSEKVILQNSNNEPYLENSCCEGKEGQTTIDYFEKKDPNITEYNNIVRRLTNILDDIVNNYTKSGLFYSIINTKNHYPPISNNFDEKTIFLSFIKFCKFDTLLPIPTDLLPICLDKPEPSVMNSDDTLERTIQKLKENGRNYTNDQFLRLLQLISRNNMINIDFQPEVSSITKLLNLIDTINEENDDLVEKVFSGLIYNALDTYDVATSETTKEVRNLNNFLIKEIQNIKQELNEFIQKNSANATRSSIKKTLDTITNLDEWGSIHSTHNSDIKISDDEMYNVVNFYKTFIENFANTFPNIILNKVNYDDVLIPSYFKFSTSHVKKLKKSISEYYQKLKTFYGVPIISNVLSKIQTTTKNLVILSKVTPCFTSIKNGDSKMVPVFDERTSKYLYEYYLLKILMNFVELSEDKSLLVTEVTRTTEVTDVFTVEYLEEEDTRIDFVRTERGQTDTALLAGSMKELRQKVAELLISFFDIFNNQKDIIDISYDVIQDRVFKLREKEKNMVTDRLKEITDEERDVDTILKITKLGPYSKALQKGLTVLDKDFYDEERDFRDEMEKTERQIRKKNSDVNDSNIDILLDDYIAEMENDKEIDEEAYDMSYMNEDFYNGNTDGVDAPEEEPDDYDDFE
jgi:hypothetical protein